ncbi:MAG: nucleotide pyrophosphohydrolase [Thermoanaerobaculia bacterium]
MPFKPLQREVDEWISQFEEGYFPPLAMLARLTEEVGELSRVLMHHYGGKTPKPGENTGEVGGEIADAMFVLICLANSLDIDLDEQFAAMMKKFRERDAERWTRKGPRAEG